ncbi:hypothetical protein [Dendronalium sp. ChiSLP03b]|uniref:hypothetical protein n=1 Tax=Dendronalium sp. ChiSLP03b TaxID=3075381 RepID=UPI002AD45EB5|nr:hypothetical protein [Dendronalium sp. ChiSLP03b]MDZ8203036.1 hypothetical protein [Dendronalium sp. ChiSLP03b]
MKKILVDQSHDELLCWELSKEEREADSWQILHGILAEQQEKLGWEVITHPPEGKSLNQNLQENEYDLLVLFAPKKSLNIEEVETIIDFVQKGKSLLFVYDYNCLWHQTNQPNQNTINQLLEFFGLRVEQLLSRRPDEVFYLHPHYLGSEVHRLSTYKPVYFKTLNNLPYSPYVVATLPETNKPFLVTVDVNPGRVLVIGDYVLFGDKKIKEKDNQKFVLNAFRWLTYQNAIDCSNASIKAEVPYGRRTKFSITLSNPHQERLEHIHCLLESDSNAFISNPHIEIRSLPPGSKTQLMWVVEPQKLGEQNLRLTIDFPNQTDACSIFLDTVAQFQCVPDAEIDLVFQNRKGEAQELIETGVPFEVQAVTRWANDAKQIPLHLELKCPLSHMLVEQMDVNRWRLTVLDEGDWKITLQAKEIDQQVTRLVHGYPSTKSKITTIERDVVARLVAEVHHKVSQIRLDFDTDVMHKIAFRLLTPDEQVRLLYQANVREHLLEALNVARSTTQRFAPLVDELLHYIAPSYSPVHGCCIPYDPKLADRLAKANPTRKENLAYNLLCMDEDDHYGQAWLEGNIAALLLHEKYGHGFFYTQTTIGKQLAILYQHGFLRDVDYEYLQFPYPQSLQAKYKKAIQALSDSTLIVNEGFATWMELSLLQRLSGHLGLTVYRRKEFLFKDTMLETLKGSSDYFKRSTEYQLSSKSKYEEGWQYLNSIQSFFGSDYGPKCAIQAVIKATDINFGITECAGQVQFGLEPETIENALLKAVNDDARADMRLKHIAIVLYEFQQPIREKQELLKCYRECLHSACPLNKIVAERLGW